MDFVASLTLFCLRLATLLLRIVLRLSFDDVPQQFDDSATLLQEYDFIVVGGGAAGSVVAGRLAEVGAAVLLLEAGGSAPPESSIPVFHIVTCMDEHYTWKLKTAPMKNTTFIYENNQQVVLQGRVMGGSTTLNGMSYLRGFKRDYDNWAQLGNIGWDYQTVLPFFKQLENYTGPPSHTTDEFMGHTGPFPISPAPQFTRVSEAFLKAGLELGFEPTVPNGPSTTGFYSYHKNSLDGVCVSTAEAFVRPNIHRPQFHVRVNSHVTKILFDGQKRATGVKFSTNRGHEQTVKARKEVIVSAGVFQSPKLLMLSGVGPVKHLREMGIPLVAGVEGVGHNLMDHPTVKHLVFSVKPGTALQPSRIFTLQNAWDYFKNRKGQWTVVPGNEGQAYVNVDDHSDDWPNILHEIVGGTFADSGGDLVNYGTGLKHQAFEELYSSAKGLETVSIGTALTRPFSRGAVSLRSTDPFDDPVIDPNMLSDPRDEDTLLKGIKSAMNIFNTTAMHTVLEAKFIQPKLSACAHTEPFSDQYWRCFIRQTVEINLHNTGTCRMAPETNPLGVVSPSLRVRGVSNLRVIDASVMPQGVSTNTMATTIMIGERGADLIKEYWGYPRLQRPASRIDEGIGSCDDEMDYPCEKKSSRRDEL